MMNLGKKLTDEEIECLFDDVDKKDFVRVNLKLCNLVVACVLVRYTVFTNN